MVLNSFYLITYDKKDAPLSPKLPGLAICKYHDGAITKAGDDQQTRHKFSGVHSMYTKTGNQYNVELVRGHSCWQFAYVISAFEFL